MTSPNRGAGVRVPAFAGVDGGPRRRQVTVTMPRPRPEYETLARDFRRLAAPFGLRVDQLLERDLVLVAAAFETMDRHVDATREAGARRDLGAAILRVLTDGGEDERVKGDLAPVLAALRVHLRGLGAAGGFAAPLGLFMVRSEALRHAEGAGEFLACVLDEARCAAQMTLVAVPGVDLPRFARFFHILSELANLTDKLHDVRGDYARGEIALRPGLWLHLRLLAAFLTRVARLLLLAPRPLGLMAWGLRYLVPPRQARYVAPDA